MSVLIVSSPLDFHALAVQWGLRQIGCEAVIWDWSAFPLAQLSSWKIAPDMQPSAQISIDGRLHDAPFDTVWYRRPGKPTPTADSHPDDAAIVRTESDEYLRNILPFFGHQDTLWVNAPEASRHAGRKLIQLAAAREVGFRIPDTLVGNDHAEVLAFFDKHQGKIIFKAFRPGSWNHEDGSVTSLITAPVERQHLESAHAVRACPGIFQPLIDKSYELRVAVMGEAVVAAAILSQEKATTVDYRTDRSGQIPVRAAKLPEQVNEQCRALCRRLGIVFGCIDLIMTKTGEYVFLEINEAGQFLGAERQDPAIPALDTFCRFLASDKERTPSRAGPVLHYADWKASSSGQAYFAAPEA